MAHFSNKKHRAARGARRTKYPVDTQFRGCEVVSDDGKIISSRTFYSDDTVIDCSVGNRQENNYGSGNFFIGDHVINHPAPKAHSSNAEPQTDSTEKLLSMLEKLPRQSPLTPKQISGFTPEFQKLYALYMAESLKAEAGTGAPPPTHTIEASCSDGRRNGGHAGEHHFWSTGARDGSCFPPHSEPLIFCGTG
ncbi:hypothetical protein HGRIS_002136 [Hohenbuehelia grisea]|uniref:Uncharacterized protein n=1 Tax=Hohenbuehelia grisea TaxID=104357 RepID=A0ABR3JJL2_9AGAR